MRTRPWGDIDGISDLPLPLPPPPSAIKAWAFALTMLIIGVVAWRFAINSEVRENPFALDAEFYVTSQAVDVRFDVDDQAWLSVVTYENGVFNRVAEHSPAAKGRFATGDGRFYLRVDAPQIAIVSSHAALENISLCISQRLSLRLTQSLLWSSDCSRIMSKLMLLSLR